MKCLIKNADVFDGHSESLYPHAKIVILEDKVVEVTDQDVSEESFDTVIDAAGRTAIPGLIDCHVHMSISGIPKELDEMRIDEAAIRTAKNAEEMLYRGSTPVRAAGDMTYGVKRCIDNGYIDGPRIYPSIGAISQTSGHSDFRGTRAQEHTIWGHESPFMKTGAFVTADGVPEVLRAVRDQLFLGASQIKIMASGGIGSIYDPLMSVQFTFEEMKAAVDAASDFGTYVFAHIYSPKAMRRAAEAGVKCFEHATLMDDEISRIILDQGIWLCPQFAFHFDDVISTLTKNPETNEKRLMVKGAAYRQAELINKYGLRTVYGTDLVMDKYYNEVYQLTEFRARKQVMGSLEAVRSATGNAHELFKLTTIRDPYPQAKVGVLEAGSFADLLLIDGDPTKDAEILTDKNNMRLIMKGGRIYKNTL